MSDAWEDRKKTLENEYFHRKEKEALEKLRSAAEADACLGHCPKCGEKLQPKIFHEVPLDHCPGCGGIWLGPNDLKALAQKKHDSWFDRWFRKSDKNAN